MSTHDDFNQNYAEPIDGSGLTPAERRILQAKADKAAELEAEVAGLKRQMAVRDAGLELNDRQRRALEATHEGDWTPEAIRNTAAELGFAALTTQAVPADELAAMQRINQAARGGDTVTAIDAEAEFDSRMAALNQEVRAGRMSNERASAEFDRLYRESGRPMNEH